MAGPRKDQSIFDCIVKRVSTQKMAMVMANASRISEP